MKRHVKVLILSLVLVVGFFTTSAPFKLIEWWARINGFAASGFSGHLLSELRIEQLKDENNKRSFELLGLGVKYQLLPQLSLNEITAEKVLVTRPQRAAPSFVEKLPQILESLARPIIVKNKDFSIQKLDLKNIEFYYSAEYAPLRIDTLQLFQLRATAGGLLTVDNIAVEGESLQIHNNGELLKVMVRLPQHMFSDLKEDLVLNLSIAYKEGFQIQDVQIWDVAQFNLQAEMGPNIADVAKWSKYFLKDTDAQLAHKIAIGAKL